MRACVTGYSGFIGSHLSRQLEASGWVLTPEKPDVIFHTAALTRNDRSIMDPVNAIRCNALLSAEIFHEARQCKIPVVYTSSAVIYSPIRTPYQISKIAADELAQWYNENGGDIRIVRLADVYGPGMTNGPIAAWREQYRRNGAIDVWDGPQKRHYVYISDVVDALIWITQKPKGTYSIGSLTPVDIMNVAKLLQVTIKKVPAPRSIAEYVPLPQVYAVGHVSLGEGMEIIRKQEFV